MKALHVIFNSKSELSLMSNGSSANYTCMLTSKASANKSYNFNHFFISLQLNTLVISISMQLNILVINSLVNINNMSATKASSTSDDPDQTTKVLVRASKTVWMGMLNC